MAKTAPSKTPNRRKVAKVIQLNQETGKTRKFDDPAAAKQLAGALRGLPDNFLYCRDPGVRHPWRITVDFHVLAQHQEGKRKIPVIARNSECDRCHTRKQEIFIQGRNGMEKLSNNYDYPENYQIPGVPRGVKPSTIVWQEQYRRAMERVAEEARLGG